MKKIAKCFIVMGIAFMLLGKNNLAVQASYEEILEEDEFENLYENVKELSEGEFDFFEYLTNILQGKEKVSLLELLTGLLEGTKKEIVHLKDIIIYIVAIGIISGAANSFTEIFEKRQSKNLGFYIMYILMITTLILVFKEVNVVAENVVLMINDFMTSLVPAYFMTVALTGNVTTSIAFYQFILILIKASEVIFINFLLPLVNVYVVLTLINGLAKEDYLSKMAELIKNIIEWCLKSTIAVVIGFNVIRGLILPAFDAFKTTSLNKTLNAIPGIGNTANAISEMLIGSAVIIKNGVGVTALVCILVITGLPLLKIGLYILVYKFSAAIIQPISDKRLVDLVEYMSKGCELLFKVAGNSVAVFMLAIAIVTAIT